MPTGYIVPLGIWLLLAGFAALLLAFCALMVDWYVWRREVNRTHDP